MTPAHPTNKDATPESLPRAAQRNMEFDVPIEMLEHSTRLRSMVVAAKSTFVKPLEKAVRVHKVAEESGGSFADALRALKGPIDCCEALVNHDARAFAAYKVEVLKLSASSLPLSKVAFEELVCFTEIEKLIETLGNDVSSRTELSRKVRDIEVKMKVMPLLKASMERVQNMVETATRSKDSPRLESTQRAG